MENLSDVQLKRCVAWMRLELLAWICLCADALVSVWAPSVWDTGRIYGLFVVVVLVSGLAAVVLSWVRNPMRWNLTGLGRRFFRGSHGSCMALSVILVFWVPGAVHRNFVCMEQYLYAGGIRAGVAPKKKERRILRK